MLISLIDPHKNLHSHPSCKHSNDPHSKLTFTASSYTGHYTPVPNSNHRFNIPLLERSGDKFSKTQLPSSSLHVSLSGRNLNTKIPDRLARTPIICRLFRLLKRPSVSVPLSSFPCETTADCRCTERPDNG